MSRLKSKVQKPNINPLSTATVKCMSQLDAMMLLLSSDDDASRPAVRNALVAMDARVFKQELL